MKEEYGRNYKKMLKKIFEERMGHLLKAYGVDALEEIFDNSSQKSQDQTKILSPLILKAITDMISYEKGFNPKDEKDGSDWNYHGNPIEIKARYAKNTTIIDWVGNKNSKKTDMHLLIGYRTNSYTITELFVGIIDLSTCKNSSWRYSESKKSSYSHLQIATEDADRMHILMGSRSKKPKWTYFFTEPL